MHVPGLTEEPPTVGTQAVRDNERGAVIFHARSLCRPAATRIDQIDEIGKPVADDQLRHTQAGGLGDAGEFIHQIGRVGLVLTDAGLRQSQHLVTPQCMAGPRSAAGEGDPLRGITADLFA